MAAPGKAKRPYRVTKTKIKREKHEKMGSVTTQSFSCTRVNDRETNFDRVRCL